MCKIIWNKQIFLELFIYRLFSFKGRASRKEYLARYLTMFSLNCIYVYVRIYVNHSNSWIVFILDSLLIITLLVYIIQMFPLIHRRLHDLNASGWWQLITLIPIAFIPFGQLLMIVFIFFKGTPGPNKYGPPPEY